MQAVTYAKHARYPCAKSPYVLERSDGNKNLTMDQTLSLFSRI